MGTPNIFYPKVTDAGKAAAISVADIGLRLTLDEVSFGTGQYDPTGAETALFNEVKRVPIAGATRPRPNAARPTPPTSSPVLSMDIPPARPLPRLSRTPTRAPMITPSCAASPVPDMRTSPRA